MSPEELAAEEEALAKEVETVLDGPKADSKPASPVEDLKQSIIIVGVYSQASGIRQRQAEIERLGFTYYSDPVGDLTRVGCIVSHSDQASLSSALAQVQENITAKAWILRESE